MEKWDAPYYPHRAKTYEVFLQESSNYLGQDDFWVITVNETPVGIVSYYYEDQQKIWLEIGCVLHQANTWNKGLGTRAMKLWVNHLFTFLDVPRIGLTTWSGNERMIQVAMKLGMQQEARIRKVRYYQGMYYDSIRMGMLREEWEIQTK